jgi:glucokinase
MILVGDLGGTHTRLAVYARSATDADSSLASVHFASADYPGFIEILQAFRRHHPALVLTRCVLAVAGPVIGNRSETPNLPWYLDAAEIADALAVNAAAVTLLNDLEAAALAVVDMPADRFHVVQAGNPGVIGNRALIAPGTGLGEAMLYWDGCRYHALATEGGHCDFAPRNETEIGLLRHALRHFPDHVSGERILSGAGIALIHEFLREGEGSNPGWVPPAGAAATAAICERALAHRDALCEQALSMYLALLGAEVGNLALKTMALGGVIIAGGVAPKILPAFDDHVFVANVAGKGRFRTLLAGIPISICLDERAPLLGALSRARARN